MQKIDFLINGTSFSFINESWSTSNSWGHETHLFMGSGRFNSEISKNKVRYYNRTWERFTYETCMLGAISNAIDSRLTDLISDYKYINKIDRFKKGEKAIVLADAEKDTKIINLRALYEAVKIY